jgi:hypothetical protein
MGPGSTTWGSPTEQDPQAALPRASWLAAPPRWKTAALTTLAARREPRRLRRWASRAAGCRAAGRAGPLHRRAAGRDGCGLAAMAARRGGAPARRRACPTREKEEGGTGAGAGARLGAGCGAFGRF